MFLWPSYHGHWDSLCIYIAGSSSKKQISFSNSKDGQNVWHFSKPEKKTSQSTGIYSWFCKNLNYHHSLKFNNHTNQSTFLYGWDYPSPCFGSFRLWNISRMGEKQWSKRTQFNVLIVRIFIRQGLISTVESVFRDKRMDI